MSTLIVTSLVVVYAVATVAYIATSEQRATRHRRRHRARSREEDRPRPIVPAVAAPVSAPAPRPEPEPAWPELIRASPVEPEPGWPEFIRASPVELEPSGPWHRLRSSVALLGLLTIVGTIVAAVVGVALVLAILALKKAAG